MCIRDSINAEYMGMFSFEICCAVSSLSVLQYGYFAFKSAIYLLFASLRVLSVSVSGSRLFEFCHSAYMSCLFIIASKRELHSLCFSLSLFIIPLISAASFSSSLFLISEAFLSNSVFTPVSYTHLTLPTKRIV
eukprot:TRINITY_DN26824_c0_g2_i1.p1 TRINITY_DN26824_c0_g2~~TRINITY_DN26824_c0_g2_i1.p1  ORF type:complete len:134 (-),score=20.34 TRINITY_DN26824_c0_g2_i1:36-437(-)